MAINPRLSKAELKEQLELFNDTSMLADFLYDLAHDDVVSGRLSGDEKENLMEARDNLIGLYELCRLAIVSSQYES